jgi:predicted permease
LRSGLVVAQVALSLILLVGAGLLVRTLDRMRNADLGFDRRAALTFQVNLPTARYDAAARARFHEQLQRELSSLPGVDRVGAISHLPSTGLFLGWGVRRLEGDRPLDATQTNANQRTVEGDYFAALRIPVLEGRVFGPGDGADAPARAVISESLAKRLFPEGGAVGGRIRVSSDALEVIGVVADVSLGYRARTIPIVYHDHRQFAANRNWAMSVVLVPRGPRGAILDQARRVLASMDAHLVMYRAEPMTEVVGRGTRRERFATMLMVAFAALAVTLSAVGIHGVLAYAVRRRQREIGVRLALGAPTRTVRLLIVGRGAWIAGAGIAAGLGGAAIAASGLSSFVYGVSVRDPAVFGCAAVILAAIVLAASWLPARSAVRVDPVTAFRSE